MKMKDELERQRELKEMRMTKGKTDSIYKPSHVVRQQPTEYKALPCRCCSRSWRRWRGLI